MTFQPRKNDTLYLHHNDKNLWIEFEDFEEVMGRTKRWFADWKRTTAEPAHYESLEDFLVGQESHLKRIHGEESVAVGLEYSLLSSIFQIAIQSAATNPKRLHKQFVAMKSID